MCCIHATFALFYCLLFNLNLNSYEFEFKLNVFESFQKWKSLPFSPLLFSPVGPSLLFLFSLFLSRPKLLVGPAFSGPSPCAGPFRVSFLSPLTASGPHLSGVSSTSRSSPPLLLGLARAPLCRWPSFQARPARRGSRNPLRARIPTTLHPSPRPNRTRLEPESWSCTAPNSVGPHAKAPPLRPI